MLIDTHCHLDFESFDSDRDSVVARAGEAGVTHIVVPSLDLTNVSAVLDLTGRYDGVFAAVGVHPNSAAGWDDRWLQELRDQADHPKVLAIGEIGLDYYRDHCPPKTQQRALAGQLLLADELSLPVILHNRDSDADMLRLLADSPLNGRDRPGVLHSFSSSWEVAEQALAMGFYLGFTGPVTYPKADVLRAVVAHVPLNRLLVETDAPFLAPQFKRGRRNEPAFVKQIAARIAQIRGLDPAELAAQTTANAVRLFGPRLSADQAHAAA